MKTNHTLNDRLAIAELERRLKESNDTTIARFKEEKPNLAKLVKSKSTHLVYKKRPEGYSKVIPDIVRLMTEADNIEKTQLKLIADVSALHPEQHITTSVWSKKLQGYEIKGIKEQLWKCGLPEDIAMGCDKLSQVRRKLKIYLHTKHDKPREFKANISIHNSRVVVGKKSYPVTIRESKGKKYPSIRVTIGSSRCWVRVDALETALLEGDIE